MAELSWATLSAGHRQYRGIQAYRSRTKLFSGSRSRRHAYGGSIFRLRSFFASRLKSKLRDGAGVGGQGLGIDLPKIFALLLATGRHRRCNYPSRGYATTRWNPGTSPLRVSAILRGISALLCYLHADNLLTHSSCHPSSIEIHYRVERSISL